MIEAAYECQVEVDKRDMYVRTYYRMVTRVRVVTVLWQRGWLTVQIQMMWKSSAFPDSQTFWYNVL